MPKLRLLTSITKLCLLSRLTLIRRVSDHVVACTLRSFLTSGNRFYKTKSDAVANR